MNPILTAAALGFAKRILMPGKLPSGHPNALHTCLIGPLAEELQFRVLPERVGLPVGLSSAAFAMAHFVGRNEPMTPSYTAFRFADTFAGGLIYSAAYRQMGYLGAVVAHAAHNLCCNLGRASGPVTATAHKVTSTRRKIRK